ncbi:MAG: GNAT family protein [Caldilineaceae bacterium]
MILRLPGKVIHLRDWESADLDPYAYWLQPGHAWQQTDGPYEPSPKADEITAQCDRLRRQLESGEFPTPRRNLVIADGKSNQLLGRVNAYWEQQASWSINLGIAIYDPAYWGRGLGYEALGMWTDYFFRTMPQIVRLGLRTWSGNGGMMRLATKLGFQEEMRLRKARVWFMANGLMAWAMGFCVRSGSVRSPQG